MQFCLMTHEEEAQLFKSGRAPLGLSEGVRPAPDYIDEADYLDMCRLLHREASKILERPATMWELSTRARNVLGINGLNTVTDLFELEAPRIMKLQKCGVTTATEIVREAMRKGYNLTQWFIAIEQLHKRQSRDNRNK